MRIAFIGSPSNGHLQRWARVLLGHGHALAIVSRDEPPASLAAAEWIAPRWTPLLNAVAFGVFRHRRSAEMFAPWAIGPALRRWRPDIVHGFDALNNGWAAVRSVPSAASVVEPFGSDIFQGWRAGRVERWLVRHALARADAVTCNFPSVGEHVRASLGVRIRRARGFSWGVDLATFRPESQAGERPWRRELSIAGDAIVVVSPRGQRTYAGRDILGSLDVVQAFAAAARAEPRLHLVVLMNEGRGPLWEEWKRLSGAVDPGRLRVVPRTLPPADVASLLRASDIFLSVPHSDLLSMSVLEGIACGGLGVVSGCPDFARVLVDEQGMELCVVRPRDPEAIAAGIRRAVEGLARRDEWGARNFSAMRAHHDAEKQERLLEELYREIARR